ncbi:MAG: tetratricopeptide (TPR) repeat protein [Paraglaciecola sp.]|jgi:tetratricopeptide (TPR) repeat protein
MTNSRNKSIIFYAISISIPFLLLFVLELGLRTTEYGTDYPLFIPAKALPGYMQPNDNVINRFFPGPQFAPKVSPDTQYFLENKPRDSFRIVVQGGSTAAGFPYGRWGSLSGMLQQRFKRLYPEKNIEIINTAMASVNTYTLLDFVEEIIQIEPDLVLIYAGHNEYLGVMGVGSAFASKGGREATLLYLRLKNLKIYRLVESAYYKIFTSDVTEKTDERTLMAKVAREKEIAYGGELYRQGLQQFEGNMSLLLDKYAKADIPVVLGNLVSNEQDQIPFSAVKEIDEKSILAWQNMDLVTRQKRLRKLTPSASSLANTNSQSTFELAYHHYFMGEYDLAQKYFSQAKDFDLLRFRAPEAFNKIIQKLSARPSVALADVQGKIRQDTQNGIIGNKHVLEHLHPSARGYFMLADAYVQQIISSELLGANHEISLEKAWQEMPITQADKQFGEYKIARLTSDYPFRLTPIKVAKPSGNSIEAQALRDRIGGEHWLSLNRKLLPLYQRAKNLPEAALISGLLADALPNNYNLSYIAGLTYKKANNLAISLYYLNRALKMKPGSISGNLSIAQNYFLMGQAEKSMQHLEFVKKNKPDHPAIDRLIETVSKQQ